MRQELTVRNAVRAPNYGLHNHFPLAPTISIRPICDSTTDIGYRNLGPTVPQRAIQLQLLWVVQLAKASEKCILLGSLGAIIATRGIGYGPEAAATI